MNPIRGASTKIFNVSQSLENLYSKIFLVFPEQISHRAELTDLFLYLISRFPKSCEVRLIVKNAAEFNKNHSHKINRHIILVEAELSDIWLGDYFPYRFDESTFFSFQYPIHNKDQIVLFKVLKNLITEQIFEVPLKLDLGAFEMIDNLLLVSQSVYDLNVPERNRDEVNAILDEYIAPSGIMIIHANEKLAHLDTMLRVFGNIVLFNENKIDAKQVEQIRTHDPKNGFHFFSLNFDLCGELSTDGDGTESYLGNPFDFLVFQDTILFPISCSQDRENLKSFRNILDKAGCRKEIIELEHPDMKKLYSMGGGLFCICGLY